MNSRILGVMGLLAGLILMGFVYLTLSGAFTRFQRTWVEEELRSRLDVLAKATAQSLVSWLVENDDLEALRILQDLVSRTEGVYQAVVVDREDRVFATYPARDLESGDVFIPEQPALRQTSQRTVFGSVPLKGMGGELYMIGVPISTLVLGQPQRIGALYILVTDRFVSQSVLQAYNTLRSRVLTITLGSFGVLLLILMGVMAVGAGGPSRPVLQTPRVSGLVVTPSDSPEHLQEIQTLLGRENVTTADAGGLHLELQTPDTGTLVVKPGSPFFGAVGFARRDTAQILAYAFLTQTLKFRLPEEGDRAFAEVLETLDLSLDFMDLEDPALVAVVGRGDGTVEVAAVGEVYAFTVREGAEAAEVIRLGSREPRLSLALARAVEGEPLRLRTRDLVGLVLAAFPVAVFAPRVTQMVSSGRISVEEVENLVREGAFEWVVSVEPAG